ncbi:hypothetical protein ANO14919_061310 [Xylariales sp. No.14919]|nr:hypothetical protein ANO14919_061310 [Xylariales sp. No.14919]
MGDFTFISQSNPDGRSRRPRSRKACKDCRTKKRRCHHIQRNGIGGSSSSSPGLSRPLGLGSPNQVNQVNHAPPASVPAPAQRSWPPVDIDVQPSSARDHDGPRAPTLASTSTTATSGHPDMLAKPDPRDARLQKQQQPPPPQQQAQQQYQHTTPKDGDGNPMPRFVGDLNPEARLIDDVDNITSPEQAQDTSADKVGVWVRQHPYNACTPSDGVSPGQPASRDRDRDQLSFASNPYLPISNLVRNDDILALTNLYFANVHPIIPLLNEHEFRQSLHRKEGPLALIYVVCLIAAKDNAAGPYLRILPLGENPVMVRTFCTQMYTSAVSMISGSVKYERITLIRILALLSLHHEGFEGPEQASNHVAQAIQHAQTLALHLHRPGADDLEMRRTFWCLWTLDRLNAATNSRPCIISNYDVSAETLTPGQSGYAAFDIWFRISKLLDTVIVLYRPTNPDTVTGIELEYAGFDQIVEEMQGWHLPKPTLATLRIFFLVTAILAFRLKTIKTLPGTTEARLRQQLSAILVIRFMKDPDRLNSLHPIPVVVYAASLALSVSYQQFRYSRLLIEQEEGYQDFATACHILRVLQQKWSAADAMASLSHRVLLELEKLPSLDMARVTRAEAKTLPPTHTYPSGQTPAPPAAEVLNPDMQSPQRGSVPVHQHDESHLAVPQEFDILGGMDDLSWMYLDAANPLSFDALPFMDFDMTRMDGDLTGTGPG